jgi:hypothetical protein
LAWPNLLYRTRQAIGCSCRRDWETSHVGVWGRWGKRGRGGRPRRRVACTHGVSRKGSTVRKEEGRGPRLAGIRKLDRVMPPSRVIAETNRRHLASNKLAKRTSKKVAGACERWPSWSLFSGATRGKGPAKRCPDAPLRGEQCPGVSRGSGSVLQALAGGWSIAR